VATIVELQQRWPAFEAARASQALGKPPQAARRAGMNLVPNGLVSGAQ